MRGLRALPLTILAILALLALPLGAPALAQEAAQETHEAAEEHAADEHAQEPEGEEHGTEEHAADEHAGDDEHAAEGDHGDEHGGEHGGEHEEVSWTVYIQKWINFVMLIGLLYWLLVVPPAFVRDNFEFNGLKEIIAERSEAILAASALAKEQLADAERRDRESAERLALIEQEAAELVERAGTEAEQDRVRIAEAAGEEADKIRAIASRDMNAEVERARRTLRAHVATLAVSIARDLVRDNISADDQDRMVREYLDRLGDSVA